jgi:hypothetical protein
MVALRAMADESRGAIVTAVTDSSLDEEYKRTVAKNRADAYRQRAQECLDLARTLSFGTKRQVLTDMAQTWLELAEEQEAGIPPIPSGSNQPVMQQQQQAQPRNDEAASVGKNK